MIAKFTFHVLVTVVTHGLTKGEELPDTIKKLQHYFGDGTSNDQTNVFYKVLGDKQDLSSQAKEALRQHLNVSDWYGFDLDHIQTFVENIKHISETKIEKDEDLDVLRSQLHESDDFQTSLLMDVLLNNRDDTEESIPAFDNAFITMDNSMVQLYYTSDEDIFSGVVVVAKRKDNSHILYLVFVID